MIGEAIVIAWNWLVANGLLRDVLSACVLVPVMRGMVSKTLRRMADDIKDIRDHERTRENAS